jgi:hypothetical protein
MMVIQAQDRLNFLQKCLCLYTALKKDETNAVVHYDEAKKHFPPEFNILFGRDPKKQGKANIHESINYVNDT